MLLNIDFLAIDSGPPNPLPVFNDFTSTLEADASVPSESSLWYDITLVDSNLEPYEGRMTDTNLQGDKMIALGVSYMAEESYITMLALGLQSKIGSVQNTFTIPGVVEFTSIAIDATSTNFYFAAPYQNTGRVGVGRVDTMDVSYIDPNTGANSAQFIARSPDHQVLIAAGQNGIAFYDIRNGLVDLLQVFTHTTRNRVTHASVSQNGDRVVVGYAGGTFAVYSRNINSWGSEVVITVPQPDANSYLSTSTNANGTTIVIGQPNGDGTGDGHVYIYDTQADRTNPTLTFTFNGEDVKKLSEPSWTGNRYQFGSAVLVSKEQKTIAMADTLDGELKNFTRVSDNQYSPGSIAPTYSRNMVIQDFIYHTLPNVHYAQGGKFLIWAHEATGIKVLKTS